MLSEFNYDDKFVNYSSPLIFEHEQFQVSTEQVLGVCDLCIFFFFFYLLES